MQKLNLNSKFYFSNVVIRDMTILAPLTAPNTDGIDPGKHCLFVHKFYLAIPLETG